MTHLLTTLAQGKVAILLEGGYNLSSISHSMVMCCKALLGDPLPSPTINSIKPSAVETIKHVIRAQQPYWNCFQFLVDLPDKNVLCPPWITDTKIHQFNQTLLHKPEITDRNLNPDEEVSDECFTHPSYPLHYPDDPLTVEQFLTLPEMVDVSIVFKKNQSNSSTKFFLIQGSK